MKGCIIRISQAGACPKRLQYERRQVEGLPPWEGAERAFAEGNLHEPSILAWAAANLPGGPYQLTDQQKEVYLLDGILTGHIDAIGVNEAGENVLIEAKCLAARGFQEMRLQGVQKAHPQYYLQVQLYMAAAGLTRAYLVARNKETPKTRMWDHYFEQIELDSQFIGEQLCRLEKLASDLVEDVELTPAYNPVEYWQCRQPWCPYTYHCHPDYSRPVQNAADRSDMAAVVELLQEINQEIKELEQFRDELKGRLQEEAQAQPIRAGRWLVELVEKRQERFDSKLARKELPAEMINKLLKVTVYRQLIIKEIAG